MNEIKCPNCGKVFQMDEAGYASIVSQVRNALFEKEVADRISSVRRESAAVQEKALAELDAKHKLDLAGKDREILQLKENDVVIMDMEAGVEHFGRGTGNSCDAVLMVVDPSYESLKLSEKIGEMCEQGGHPLYYVLNKVTEKNLPAMEAKIAHPEKIACRLPMKEELLDAGLSGDTLDGVYPEICVLTEMLKDI